MLYRGLLIDGLTGKINGAVASHGPGGAYFRSLGTPTNPNTSRQILIRSAAAAAYANWTDLSPTLRATWEQYARSIARPNRIGKTFTRSGWNEFVRAYTYRHYAEAEFSLGLTTTLSSIVGPEFWPGEQLVGSIATGVTDFTMTCAAGTDWQASTENALLLELSGVRTAPGVVEFTPLPPTRNSFKGPWQLAGGSIGGHGGGTLTIPLTRAPVQFERIFWKARVTSLLRGMGTIQYGVAIAP